MLAYFFYHWKSPTVTEIDYENRLRDFQEALTDTPPEGFSTSWCVALKGTPWANGGGNSYEDWYVLRNSADLDPLNDAAVSASRKVPHDKAAAGAADGAGGLYRVRAGEMIRSPRFTTWFAKPDGWSYAQLYERLSPTMSGGGALWQRQMAIGPGEFCLHTNVSASLPAGIDGHSIALRSVFPASA
jgi:hypothetical protein